MTVPASKPINQVLEPKGDIENAQNQHIGISRGGRNTKIHAVVDALGNPLHVHLSAGNCHDSTHTQEALSDVPIEGSTVLADKAYGAKSNRTYIASRGAAYCIPPKSNEKDPWVCDWRQYKERHPVECFFQKLKQFCRIATRFDKLARRFLAFVHLGCALIWLA